MSRLEWVLSGFLALLMIAFTVLLLLTWSERQEQDVIEVTLITPEAPTPAGGPGAQGAVGLAAPVARMWANDAQLVSAFATWPDATVFTPEGTGWTLLFYSPANQATAQVAVSSGNAVLLSSHTTDAQLEPASLDGWSVDSPQAVDILLTNGGQSFIDAHGDVGLALSLNANGVLRWRARLVDTTSGAALGVELDARTGAIVDRTASQGDQ